MKYTQLLILVANRPAPKRSWTELGKIIDAGHANSHFLNSRVTKPNLTNISHDVEKWSLIKLLKLELCFNLFWHAACQMNVDRQIAAELQLHFLFCFLPVTGPIFTKLLHDVDALVSLLMHA